jgi:hypothetical protein
MQIATMQITDQQLQAIDAGQPVPLMVEGRPCVLLPGTLDELRSALDDWAPRTTQRAMAQLMADDWNDPAMSVYDE